MLLAVDIGNTDAVFGFFSGETLVNTFRVRAPKTEKNLAYYEYRFRNFLLENDMSNEVFSKAVISSVVPSLTDVFVELTQKFSATPPILIQVATYKGMTVAIDNPAELGTDLLANAVAAYRRFGTNCIVVDFGTALTFTAVSARAEVLGVAIAPGLKTAVNALFSKTAQLPDVPLVMPDAAIGKNTVNSIQSGILFGYEGLVKSLVGRFRAELGGECHVIATGGLSSVITTLADTFDVIDRNLTLNGIRLIGEDY